MISALKEKILKFLPKVGYYISSDSVYDEKSKKKLSEVFNNNNNNNSLFDIFINIEEDSVKVVNNKLNTSVVYTNVGIDNVINYNGDDPDNKKYDGLHYCTFSYDWDADINIMDIFKDSFLSNDAFDDYPVVDVLIPIKIHVNGHEYNTCTTAFSEDNYFVKGDNLLITQKYFIIAERLFSDKISFYCGSHFHLMDDDYHKLQLSISDTDINAFNILRILAIFAILNLNCSFCFYNDDLPWDVYNYLSFKPIITCTFGQANTVDTIIEHWIYGSSALNFEIGLVGVNTNIYIELDC